MQAALLYNPHAAPHSLLSTKGADWAYQRNEKMEADIAKDLSQHYHNWVEHKGDKQNHTLFLALGGVGTGKSRLLKELPDIIKRTASDHALKGRLDNSLVFNVSFENGTPADAGNIFSDVNKEIGTRMMFQMLEGEKDWGDFSSDDSNHKTVGQVVAYLAESLKVGKQELTVFLMVDGVQKLILDANEDKEREDISVASQLSKSTRFYNCISLLSGLVNQTISAFMICCCAATLNLPVNHVLAGSPQKRLHLIPHQLDGSKIISHEGNQTLQVLIEDMGGHGRAIECLEEELQQLQTPLSNYGYSKFANNVCHRLERKYPDWVQNSTLSKDAFALCLSGVAVTLKMKVVGNMTVDDLLSLGLFQLADDNHLLCAYVWLWAVSDLAGDLQLDDYAVIERNNNDNAPPGAQCWQHWEEFNTRFRKLKSSVLSGKSMPVTDFHAGATFDDSTSSKPPTLLIQELDVKQASHRYDTKSGGQDEIKCKDGTFNVSAGNTTFLNGAGALAVDAFLGLTGGNPPRTRSSPIQVAQQKSHNCCFLGRT